ncbi:MAG TPA: hypothetical protein DCZ94_18790 [Lentisphaeria bacterium]|nr:MAG: hypothetical protein A2X48_22105 [Lentisphaerae bacterium GWF2_49_21]HBC88991.1 hypothetical protein [Lentisphaeria bacterium]
MKNTYEWLRRSRTFLYDAYWPPFTPELKYTSEDGIAVAKKMNANVIRFGSIGKWALYPSKIMPCHPNLKGQDLLGGTIDLAHRNGIKIIVYIPVSHALPTEIVWKKKPEWAFLGDGGKFVESVKHFGGLEIVPTCMNGKYHEAILGIVREIVNNYDPDGIYLDGPYQGWAHHKTICQCKACKDLYLSETGLKLPVNKMPDGKCVMNTPEGGKYLSWINEKLANILSEIRDITKSRKDIPLIINRTAVKITGLDNERAMIKLIDGFLTETDAGGIEGFSYGAVQEKIVWNYTTQHRWWPRLSSIRLEKESALEAYRTMSMCATPIVAYAGRYFYESENSNYMKSALSRMKSLEEFSRGSSPAKFSAVLFPGGKAQATVDFHALMKINPDAYEIYKCLHANGIPAMVLPDYMMDDKSFASSFKIICVPSSLKISGKLSLQFKEFVEEGGTLLVSGSRNTGTRDRESKIEALLGIEVLKGKCEERRLMEELRWLDKAYEFYIKASDRVKGFKYAKTLMPQCDFIPFKPMIGSEIAAHTVCWPKGEKRFPAVVVRKTGKGQSIYFNSPVEDLLSIYGQIEIKEFLSLLLKKYVGRKLPFEINSPRPLSVSIAEKEGMKILHVLNEENFGAETEFSLVVGIPSGSKIISAKCLIGGKSAKFTTVKNGIQLKELKISDYECIVLKLSKLIL